MPTFGERFWQLLTEEIAKRAAANQVPPTREERIAMLTNFYDDAVAELTAAIKASQPAAGLFDGPKERAKPVMPSIPREAKQLYEAYPRHQGRDAALLAIARALAKLAHDPSWDRDRFKTPADFLMDRVAHFTRAMIKARTEMRFIPQPRTWFSQGRYFDDPKQWDENAKVRDESDDAPEYGIYNAPPNWQSTLRTIGRKADWPNDLIEQQCTLPWGDVMLTVRQEILKSA